MGWDWVHNVPRGSYSAACSDRNFIGLWWGLGGTAALPKEELTSKGKLLFSGLGWTFRGGDDCRTWRGHGWVGVGGGAGAAPVNGTGSSEPPAMVPLANSAPPEEMRYVPPLEQGGGPNDYDLQKSGD